MVESTDIVVAGLPYEPYTNGVVAIGINASSIDCRIADSAETGISPG